MRRRSRRSRVPAVAGLLAAVAATTLGCGGDPDAIAEAPLPPHFRMVMLSVAPASTYSAAAEVGARERAAELGVVLDVLRAAPGSGLQVQQLREAVRSGQYIGGFVLPVTNDQMCDVSTDFAPEGNFMVAVAGTPVCGREAQEGEDAWAPGTLTFVSAGQEVSNFARWGDYIRAANTGQQKIILLTAQRDAGRTRNAEAALRAIEDEHQEFDVVQTVYTDGTVQDAAARVRTALAARRDFTIVASVQSELTEAAAQVLAALGNDRVRVYDVGGDSGVLALIDSGQVQMTVPQYPQTLGATAVQALYDARTGRTPITRFYASTGRAAPGRDVQDTFAFVTETNLRRFRAADLSEY